MRQIVTTFTVEDRVTYGSVYNPITGLYDLSGPLTGSTSVSTTTYETVNEFSKTDSIRYEPRSIYRWRRKLHGGQATSAAYGRRTDDILSVLPFLGTRRKESSGFSGSYQVSIVQLEYFSGLPNVVGVDYYLNSVPEDDDPVISQGISAVLRFRRSCLEDFNARMLEQATFNSVLFIAEFNRTRRLLEGPTRLLFEKSMNLADHFRRRVGHLKYRTNADYTRLASKLYLEAQFGWKPLLADINDALSTLKSISADDFSRRVSLSRTGYSTRVSSDSQDVAYPYGLSSQSKRTTRIDVVPHVQYSGRMKLAHDPKLVTYLSLLGALPKQLPLAAWEITPFSFLIDYFVNINNVLSYRPDLKHQVDYTSRVFRDKYSSNFRFLPRTHPSSEGVFTCTYGELSTDCYLYFRDVEPEVGEFLWPHLRVPRPTQLLNIAALVGSFSNFH